MFVFVAKMEISILKTRVVDTDSSGGAAGVVRALRFGMINLLPPHRVSSVQRRTVCWWFRHQHMHANTSTDVNPITANYLVFVYFSFACVDPFSIIRGRFAVVLVCVIVYFFLARSSPCISFSLSFVVFNRFGFSMCGVVHLVSTSRLFFWENSTRFLLFSFLPFGSAFVQLYW